MVGLKGILRSGIRLQIPKGTVGVLNRLMGRLIIDKITK